MTLDIGSFLTTYLAPLWNGDLNVLHSVYWTGGTPAIKGILYIIATNFVLQSYMLFDFTSEEELKSVNCTEEDFKYRRVDGTCNNKEMPMMGARGTRIGRNVRSDWETETPPSSYLWHPAPEAAATLMSPTGGERVELSSLNLFFGAWIQFQVHDWFNHDTDSEAVPYTMNTTNGKSTFPLKPTKRDSEGYTRSTVTQWWDMSQVYGSDEETASQVRSFVDGKLKLTEDGLLLRNSTTGQMNTGFTDNLWTGLETLHTLYSHEHNYICEQLKQRNPDFDDEKLYQTARLINAAQNAIIHTAEWTGILLQNAPVSMALHIALRGIEKTIDVFPDSLSWVEKALLKLMNTFGIDGSHGIGDKTLMRGGAYSQTEEFVSVYRMHALLPDNLTFDGETVALQNHAFRAGRRTMEKHGMEKAIEGFASMKTCALVLNNYPYTLSHLVKDGDELNMAAVDIFRDRERGVPKFNDFREGLGLSRFETFEDVNPDQATADKLRAVYDTVDDIDLQVGMMAENPRPEGFAIAETTFYIFLAQTTRRLQADRFFQEALNEDTYTAWGYEYVFSARFKRLFENNFPSTVDSFIASGDFPLKNSAFLRKQ